MTVLEALIEVRAKIDKPQKWCAYWSQSEDGKRLGADGAIWKICGFGTELSKQVFNALARQSGVNPQWDDNSRVTSLGTHKELMEMFDKAIEAERSKS